MRLRRLCDREAPAGPVLTGARMGRTGCACARTRRDLERADAVLSGPAGRYLPNAVVRYINFNLEQSRRE